MKKHKKEIPFLQQLELIPNVSLACEKVGVARNTVYRWCKEDSDFKARMDRALASGVESINDLAESKLVSHINNSNLKAIQYWLDNHKKNYMRPRPKNFWETIQQDNRVTGIRIIRADPDKIRKEREKKKKEEARKNKN